MSVPTFDVQITDDGILEVIHLPGQEPVHRIVAPRVLSGFSVAAMGVGADKALILVLRSQYADESFGFAMEKAAARSLVLALATAIQREFE